MRLLRYDFTISHIPGQDLITVDALSRAPVSNSTAIDQLLEEEADANIQAVRADLQRYGKHNSRMSSARKLSSTVRRVGLPSTNW